MAKKRKKEPEHENLERWLVSYGDFITLLFATFVVLYALSQVDVAKLEQLDKSLKEAFDNTLLQGDESIMDKAGQSIMDSGSNGMNILSVELQQMETKYEDESFNEIKEDIEKMAKEGNIDGINVTIDEKGLKISFEDNLIFDSGSAIIKKSAMPMLSKTAFMLKTKFPINFIRVEGHTDNIPISSVKFPSNWELSSARASSVVRYLIQNYKFKSNRLAVIGFADSRPLKSNLSPLNRAKNRRVEILVLRNQVSAAETSKDYNAAEISRERADRLKEIEKEQKKELNAYRGMNDAVKNIIKDSGQKATEAVVVEDEYAKKNKEIAKEIKKFEQEKKKEVKLPDFKMKNSDRQLSDEEKQRISDIKQTGKMNDAVADIINKRGTTKDTVVIQAH